MDQGNERIENKVEKKKKIKNKKREPKSRGEIRNSTSRAKTDEISKIDSQCCCLLRAFVVVVENRAELTQLDLHNGC